jgi:hypothetical protein
MVSLHLFKDVTNVFMLFYNESKQNLEFGILRAVYMKDTVFWVVTQGKLLEMYRTFGGTRSFHLTFKDSTSLSHQNPAKFLRFHTALERRKQYFS